jgi:hypothetical protein
VGGQGQMLMVIEALTCNKKEKERMMDNVVRVVVPDCSACFWITGMA